MCCSILGLEYTERVVGVYSSQDKAREAPPIRGEWKITEDCGWMKGENKDGWFFFPVTVDARVDVAFQAWKDKDAI